MPEPWDAATYDRIADPQARWGREVVDRLPLRGDETVLDAGCGSGRVTEWLAERLPEGRLIALDASEEMLDQARARLARFGDRVRFVQADLARPLPLHESVDAILSTATFHWIVDHAALFANLARALRPDGRLVAQCGGIGNLARLRQALEAAGSEWIDEVHFATPDETRARLEAAGFEAIEVWLTDEPTRFEPGEPFRAFLRTVCLRLHLARIAEPAAREAFVEAVAAQFDEPLLDYVRLNVSGRRVG